MNQVSVNTGYIQCKLLKFFIFNPEFGKTDDDEDEKIIFFWPTDTEKDEMMNDIGLCEALITFSSEFAQVPPTSCRTERTLYMFLQPEKNWWIIMVLQNPMIRTAPQGGGPVTLTYKPEDLDEKALLTHVRRIYVQFKLFNGPFEYILQTYPQNFRDQISEGFRLIEKYKPDLEKNDIFSSLDGIHFLPVDKNVYLRIQSVINDTENTFENILYTSFMYKHYLVWSGLEQEEMRGIYRYIEEVYKDSQIPLVKVSSTDKSIRSSDQMDEPFKPVKPKILDIFLGTNNILCYLILFQLNDCSFAIIVEKKKETEIGLPENFVPQLSKLIISHISLISRIISEHAKKKYFR